MTAVATAADSVDKTKTAASRARAVSITADAKAAPKTSFIIDTTATPDSGPRTHHLMVDGLTRPFEFKAGVALELPVAIANKFLKHEAFVPVDAGGNRIAFRRTPKQPDELGAGESLKLSAGETVARYDELSTQAIHQRATALIGGERFAVKPEAKPVSEFRAEMIDFIVKTKEAIAKANLEKKERQNAAASTADDGLDEFTPEPEDDDEDLAA